MTIGLLISNARITSGLTQAELAARAGTSQAAIARYESDRVSPSVSTLERVLRAAGVELVISGAQANQTDLSSEKAQLVRRHKVEIIELARTHGARNVRLFGSVARGEDTLESDIDFLVKTPDENALSIAISLQAALESLLGCKVDVSPESILKPNVRKAALREAVTI
jgi:predicted nucleotidyltransferase/DNA-binding XRE family transcriptional regulator